MAEIAHLKAGEDPPAGQDWVLVTRDTSGKYVSEGSVTHSRGATFYVPQPLMDGDLERVLRSASAWADDHGLPTVYVRGVPDAPPGSTRRGA